MVKKEESYGKFFYIYFTAYDYELLQYVYIF